MSSIESSILCIMHKSEDKIHSFSKKFSTFVVCMHSLSMHKLAILAFFHNYAYVVKSVDTLP